MKKIVLIRHGSNTGDVLNTEGIACMRALKEVLGPKIGESFKLYSSEAPVAVQSAEILAKGTDVKVKKCFFLYSDHQQSPCLDRLMTLLTCTSKEYAIVVTHYEWVNGFPAYLFERLGWEPRSVEHLDPGEAYLFDCEMHTVLKLSPAAARR